MPDTGSPFLLLARFGFVARGIMYFVARSTQGGMFAQHLHAVNIVDGSEVAGSPTLISATARGTGSGNVQFCAAHDFIIGSGVGFNLTGSTCNNVTFSNNVLYNLVSVGVNVPATSGTNITIDNNVAILSVNNNSLFSIGDVGITCTNNTAVSSGGSGFTISESAAITGTFSGNLAHSNGSNSGHGFVLTGFTGGTMGSTLSWRNVSRNDAARPVEYALP